MTLFQAFVLAVQKLVAVTPVKVSRDDDRMVAGRVKLFDGKGRLTVDGRVVSRAIGEEVTPFILAGAAVTVPGFAALTDGVNVWSRALAQAKADNAADPKNPALVEFREAVEAMRIEARLKTLASVTELEDFRANKPNKDGVKPQDAEEPAAE